MSYRLQYDDEPFLGGPLPGKIVLELTQHLANNYSWLFNQIDSLPSSRYHNVPDTQDNTYERVVARGGIEPEALLSAIGAFESSQGRLQSRDQLIRIACQLIRYKNYFISDWFTDDQLAAAVEQLKAELPDVWRRKVNRQGENMGALDAPIEDRREWDRDGVKTSRAIRAMNLDFGNDSRAGNREGVIYGAFVDAAIEAAMQEFGVKGK